MLRKYSKLLVASTLLLTVLMMLSCATKGGEPTLRRMMLIQLELYEKQDDINEACGSTSNVNGCTYYRPRGVSRIILPTPKDFCDWNAMRTAGHELWHAAGYRHDPTYAVDKWNKQPPWSSSTCDMWRDR